MKKILSLILAGLMTVSCAAFVAADDAAVEATTDPVQDYAIEFLANCGVFKGGEGLTNEDLIQRYQMALFVSRISTGWVDDATWEDGTANDATFKDIDTEPASKYLGALSYANQNGIIEGYTANTFAPYASITYRDALTMVVRTLGYKGLSYPWGNIEKAVELGLTEGVDAAYTDELTRGEVAVIIYNAMFAKNSKGETLAKSIFGYDFGFQNIIVVNTDEYTTVYDKDGKAIYAAAGYIGFSIIDENGTVGSKVYYVDADELGLTGHAEEQAVGAIYVALFTIESDLVDILDSTIAYAKAPVVNNGITDNKGVKYETMPIAAELANYKLVKEYTNGVLNYTFDDLKVYGFTAVDVVDLDGKAALVGIKGNDIVYWDEVNEKWVTAWFYNSTLDKYYDYYVSDKNKDKDSSGNALTSGVAINWMSEAEFVDWYNKIIKKTIGTYDSLTLLEAAATVMKSGKAPYAVLELYNIDADDAADIANYKEYSIGLFMNSTMACGVNADGMNHSSGKYATYKITGLDGEAVYEQFVEEGHAAHENEKNAQFAWLTVDPSVTTFDATKASADGEVVLYNVNKTTGEIEIVKHITAGTNDDADSKIITGVLQAYSTSKQTVTIDGQPYPISYANTLPGDEYYMKDTGVAERARIGEVLDEQYMQYITAVICDGYVVDTDLRGADADSIVVLGYAGITSDGYIAVYGYKTDALKLEVFKINSYNGWKKGDYRYYPENAEEDDAFDFGALYTVKSFDKETGSYGVYTENVETVLEQATPVRISFRNGYRVVQPMDITTTNYSNYTWTTKKDADGNEVAATITAMAAADKYVYVTNMGGTGLTSNIFVYDGIVDDDTYTWYTDAFMVGALNSSSVVLYALDNARFTANNLTADTANDVAAIQPGIFFANNAYEVGYVLYEGGKGQVLEAAYDEAIGGTYLLGSTLSSVRVMNLLTGDRDTVIASSNIDLVAGHVYKTIGGQILWDITDECIGLDENTNTIHGFLEAMGTAYGSFDTDYAYYIVAGNVVLTKDTYSDLVMANYLDLLDVTGTDAEAWLENADATDKALADKMINTVKIYLVTDELTWNWRYENHFNFMEVTSIDALNADTKYTGTLVYNVANGNAVYYVVTDEDGLAGDGQNIVKDDPTGEIKGTLYVGKDNKIFEMDKDSKIANHAAKWTVKNAGSKDRYFDIQLDYVVKVTYADTLCKDIKTLELTDLTLTIVEMVEDSTTAGKWSANGLGSCNSDLHDLLAEAGIGFGHINEVYNANGIENIVVAFDKYDGSDVLSLNTDEDVVTVDYLDECGLVYKITCDLSDSNAYANGNGFQVGVFSSDFDYANNKGFAVVLNAEYAYMNETVTGTVGNNAQKLDLTKTTVIASFVEEIILRNVSDAIDGNESVSIFG